jgi:predicted ATP-grasp superfamily ATP-dependent carboligase
VDIAHRGRVLVTDGGSGQGRSALAAVRALAAAGYRPAVTVSGPRRWSLAGSSRYAAGTVVVPPVDTGDYAAAVRDELASREYRTILPASDAALVALELPGAALVDKRDVARRAAAAGLGTVPTSEYASGDALIDAAGALPYPVVVKPAVSRFPAVYASGRSDVSALAGRPGPLLVQPFVREPLRAVAGVVQRGRLVAVVHQVALRTWPVPCGTSSAAVTVPPDHDLEAQIVELLGDYDGIFQVQLAGTNLLDLNPRVYGSLPLAVAAGVNLAAVACQVAQGEPVPFRRAREGSRYRWLEGDLRHLAGGLRHGRLSLRQVVGALRPRPGTAHSVESIVDPGPLVARGRYALRGGS